MVPFDNQDICHFVKNKARISNYHQNITYQNLTVYGSIIELSVSLNIFTKN